MKIGLLVDGQSEYRALPHLLSRLMLPHSIITQPLLCDMQPFSTPAQIAHAASKKWPILLSRGATSIVVILDKETREDCTGELVAAIEHEMGKRLAAQSLKAELHVVLKVSTLENWLTSDPHALRALPGMFKDVDRIQRQIAGGRADQLDALSLLKSCAQRDYDKVAGAVAICKKLDHARAAANSRSFRKLMKTLGVSVETSPKAKGRR
jgi:Domain of unknown function (DUF4276)